MDVDRFLGIIPTIKKIFREQPHKGFGFESARSRRGLSQAIHYGLPKEEVATYFVMAQNISSGAFRYAAGNGKFSTTIWDEEFSFEPDNKIDPGYLIFPHWKHAFDLAVMRRRTDDLKFLTSLPESLLVTDLSSTPEFDIAFYRFLSHFFQGGEGTGDLLVRCFELLLERSDNPVRDAYLNAITWPELKLYEAFIRRDQEMLNTKLEEAVESHHKYYAKKDKKQIEDGWISLSMMAAATLVKDNSDLKVAETPYTYQPIIEGNI